MLHCHHSNGKPLQLPSRQVLHLTVQNLDKLGEGGGGREVELGEPQWEEGGRKTHMVQFQSFSQLHLLISLVLLAQDFPHFPFHCPRDVVYILGLNQGLWGEL